MNSGSKLEPRPVRLDNPFRKVTLKSFFSVQKCRVKSCLAGIGFVIYPNNCNSPVTKLDPEPSVHSSVLISPLFSFEPKISLQFSWFQSCMVCNWTYLKLKLNSTLKYNQHIEINLFSRDEYFPPHFVFYKKKKKSNAITQSNIIRMAVIHCLHSRQNEK